MGRHSSVLLPEAVLDGLEDMARKSRRSRNSQIVIMLTQALTAAGYPVDLDGYRGRMGRVDAR
jgi:hypothetical protein